MGIKMGGHNDQNHLNGLGCEHDDPIQRSG